MSLGIPSLMGGLTIATGLLLGGIATATTVPQKKIYGVYSQETDKLVIQWDSCIYFEYHNESSISDAPQEQGAFISYNKVANPFLIRTRGTRKNASERNAFLDECEQKLDSLELYKFVTPDHIYNDVNLVGVNYYRSTDAGYSILSVDFTFKEVRINKDSRYEKAKEPSGEKQKSTGQVTAK
jgi:hypothetical protein